MKNTKLTQMHLLTALIENTVFVCESVGKFFDSMNLSNILFLLTINILNIM